MIGAERNVARGMDIGEQYNISDMIRSLDSIGMGWDGLNYNLILSFE